MVPSSGAWFRAQAVLEELIEPVEAVSVDLPMPLGERARAVAAGLVTHAADRRTLDP